MAEAIAEGIKEVPGAEVALRRAPETLSEEVLRKMGAFEAQKGWAHVPVCTVKELTDYDAIFFGTPTRFGNMCGQMRQFLDATGGLWFKGSLVGKVGSVFTCSGTQHGGQESTILTFHTNLLAHGMVVVGLPYSVQGADAHRRDHRLLPVRRVDHRGHRRRPDAVGERAGRRPVPGQARGGDRREAGEIAKGGREDADASRRGETGRSETARGPAAARRIVLHREARPVRAGPARGLRHVGAPGLVPFALLQRGPHPRRHPGDLRSPGGGGDRRAALPGEGHARPVGARVPHRARGPRGERRRREGRPRRRVHPHARRLPRDPLAQPREDGRAGRRDRDHPLAQPPGGRRDQVQPSPRGPRGHGRDAGDRGDGEPDPLGRTARGEEDPVRARPERPDHPAVRLHRRLRGRVGRGHRHGGRPRGGDPDRRRSPGGIGRGLLGTRGGAVRAGHRRGQRRRGPLVPLHDGGLGRQDPDGLLVAPRDGGADRDEGPVRRRLRQRHGRRPARDRDAQRRPPQSQPLPVRGDRLPLPAAPRVAGGRGSREDGGEQRDDRPGGGAPRAQAGRGPRGVQVVRRRASGGGPGVRGGGERRRVVPQERRHGLDHRQGRADPGAAGGRDDGGRPGAIPASCTGS